MYSVGFKHQTTSSQRAGNPTAIGMWNSWRCRTRIFGEFGQIVRRPRTFVRNSRKMSRSFGMFGKSSNDSTKPRTPTKWILKGFCLSLLHNSFKQSSFRTYLFGYIVSLFVWDFSWYVFLILTLYLLVHRLTSISSNNRHLYSPNFK